MSKMINVAIDKGESYPVFGLVDTDATYAAKVKISEKTRDRWLKAAWAYNKVQDEMEKKFNKTKGNE